MRCVSQYEYGQVVCFSDIGESVLRRQHCKDAQSDGSVVRLCLKKQTGSVYIRNMRVAYPSKMIWSLQAMGRDS